MWTCPQCKAPFVTKNQWHSCLRHDLDAHFASRPDWQVEVFDALCQLFESQGDFRIRSVKSAIIFKKRSGIASLKLRKDSILLEWTTNRWVEDERVIKTLQMSKNRISHVVQLKSLEDFDRSLRGYLREAFEVGFEMR